MTRRKRKNEPEIPKMADPEAVWRIIGLAVRAGRVMTGTEGTHQALRRNKARLVLLATDTAEDTAQKTRRLCQQTGVPLRQFGTKADMGHWTGHAERAVSAILDDGFTGRIIRLIDELEDHAGRAGSCNNDHTTLGG